MSFVAQTSFTLEVTTFSWSLSSVTACDSSTIALCSKSSFPSFKLLSNRLRDDNFAKSLGELQREPDGELRVEPDTGELDEDESPTRS